MTIYTLIENTAGQDGFLSEHGLSLYIETDSHRILFDCGQSDAFIRNAERLGIDLSKVDMAILSHGHYDHGGGFAYFLELNDKAPVYLSRYAFEPHYNAQNKNIGLDSRLTHNHRLVFVDDELNLGDGIMLKSCNRLACFYPTNPFGLQMKENGSLKKEDFRHEQYLLIQENGKRYCFSGCSHKGILNVVRWFEPDVLVGGFHFKSLAPESDELKQAARIMLNPPTVYYTGHCTGVEQYAVLKRIMGDRLHYLSTGYVIEI